MTTRRIRIGLLAAGALALAGCGISDPYNGPGARSAATGSTAAPAAPAAPAVSTVSTVRSGSAAPTPPIPPSETIEHPGEGPIDPHAPAPTADGALPSSPRAAIARYADLTGTWTWRDVAARYRDAARVSVQGARADAEQAARQIPLDSRYQDEQLQQQSTLEAALPRSGSGADSGTDSGSGASERYLVVQHRVYRVRATPASSAWVVSLVALRRVGDGWAVSAWDDQA